MSLLSRIFGGGTAKTAAEVSETYKEMQIFPEPQSEGKNYRLCARNVHVVDGDTREHRLIRADTFQDIESANSASIEKAKQMIDEQGPRLFD